MQKVNLRRTPQAVEWWKVSKAIAVMSEAKRCRKVDEEGNSSERVANKKGDEIVNGNE